MTGPRLANWLALFAFAIILGVLGACGGGGSSSDSGTSLIVSPIPTTLNLGTSTLDPSGLEVRTSISTDSVASDGTVTVDIFNGGPQYAEVVDGSGRTVLLGYLSDEDPTLSARTTAIALGFLYLAGPGLGGQAREDLLARMDELPGFDAFVDAVQAQIDAEGYLNFDSPTFKSAVEAFVGGTLTRSRGVIADPTTASGLSLDTTVAGKLTVQNVYLRRVNLYLKRVSYVDKDGKAVEDTGTNWAKTEMPLVARYGGITGTIDGFLKGEVPYSPVSTNPPLSIPLSPGDAQETKYEMYAIGPGFLTNAHFNSAPQTILDDLTTLELKALFLDVFMVFVTNVALPINGEAADNFIKFVGGNAVVTDIINNLKTTVPQLGEQLAAGDYTGAMKTLFTSAYTSNTILPAIAQLALDFIDQNASLTDATYDKIFSGMSGLLEKMGKIDVGFTVADLGLLFHDVAVSQKVEKFNLTVTPGKITLVAGALKIRPTDTTTIKAIIQDKDPSGTYEYEWKVAPSDKYYVEDSKLKGTDDSPDGILRTADDTVNIRSTVSTNGSAVVSCEAFRIDNGRERVGAASITITFDANTEVIVERTHEWQILSKMNVSTNSSGTVYYTPNVVLYFDVPKISGAYRYDLIQFYIDLGRGTTRTFYEPINQPITGLPNPNYVKSLFGPEANPPANTLRYYNWTRTVVGGYTDPAKAQLGMQSLIDQANEEKQNFIAQSKTYKP